MQEIVERFGRATIVIVGVLIGAGLLCVACVIIASIRGPM